MRSAFTCGIAAGFFTSIAWVARSHHSRASATSRNAYEEPPNSPADAPSSTGKIVRLPSAAIAAKLDAEHTAAELSKSAAGALSAVLVATPGRIACQRHDRRLFARQKMFQFAGGTVPATPAQMVEFLAAFAEKLAVATLERRLTGIHHAQLEHGLVSPVYDEAVKKTMTSIKRTFGMRPRQVRPFLENNALGMLVMVERQKPKMAAHDEASLLLCFAGAFRRSELVSIRCEHMTARNGGIEVVLVQSKSEQSGAGRTVFIPYANGDRCPVLALRKWPEHLQYQKWLRIPGR